MYITLNKLAEEQAVDLSYVSKLVKEHKIKPTKVKRESDGKVCNAITLKDYARLKKVVPAFKYPYIKVDEVSVDDAAERLSISTKRMRELIEDNKVPSFKRHREGHQRATLCIKERDFANLVDKTDRVLDYPRVAE